MKDYSKGKIYGAWYNNKYIYIGSTINSLKRRIDNHKSSCKNEKENNTLYYQFLNTLSNNEYQKIEYKLIENYSCNSLRELLDREGHYQRLYIDTLYNKNIANRTIKEWYDMNNTKLKEKMKNYYNENKGELIQKAKNLYNENKKEILLKRKELIDCECGEKVRRNDKARHCKSKKHLKKISVKIND